MSVSVEKVLGSLQEQMLKMSIECYLIPKFLKSTPLLGLGRYMSGDGHCEWRLITRVCKVTRLDSSPLNPAEPRWGREAFKHSP